MIDDELISQWESRVNALETEVTAVKAAGRWRNGPRTLMELLGLHEREVKLVSCLAWLLKPEGHHGLGDQVARGLFAELGVSFDPTARVRVAREERRYDAAGKPTPADLVIRVGDVCVLIEAKINAGQHGDQIDRLERLWAHEKPVLVYLTRVRETGPAGWKPLDWWRIAGLLTPLEGDASAGAREFVETLRLLYPREGSTVSDQKTDFYLRNWRSLSEWAALRDGAVKEVAAAVGKAVAALDDAILAETQRSAAPEINNSYWTYELSRPTWRQGEIHAAIAVQWQPTALLTEPHPWPYVGVRLTTQLSYLPKHKFVQTMIERLKPYAKAIGWADLDTAHGWLWWRYLSPTGDDHDLDSLTDACRTALESGWRALSSPLDDLYVTAASGSGP